MLMHRGIRDDLGTAPMRRTERMDHFQPELFAFLAELKENNSREWFQANKDRYRSEVQEPMIGFISAFAEPLREISSNFVADPRPSGGSMFRIYRDVRFSRDKSPYKVHAAAQFRHREGRDVHAPGFYLHLEPGRSSWAPVCGTRRSDPGRHPARHRRRPRRLASVGKGLDLGGESLKRAPRGFDPDHPLIEDLKRKDFVCFTDIEPGGGLSDAVFWTASPPRAGRHHRW